MPAAKKVFGALVSVVVILLLAAILIPAYLRSKIADGGDLGVQTLRVICSANETYSSTYDNGFATTLSQLDGLGKGAGDCDHALLLDSATASGRKYDYIYTYTAKPSTNPPAKGCSQAGASAFSVSAAPVKPRQSINTISLMKPVFLESRKTSPPAQAAPLSDEEDQKRNQEDKGAETPTESCSASAVP